MKKIALGLLLLIAISNVFGDGAKYLIIVRDNFFDAVQPLAQWKQKKGISTKVVKISEIGTGPEAIKSYITNAYRDWISKPEYILLVGDINQIKPYQHSFCGPTDNPYADVEGDAQLEIAIGRLPCRTRSQLKIMINKIFLYERRPYLVDTLWYRKATTVRQDPGPYHNAGVEFVRSMILNNSDFTSVDTLVVPTDDRWNLRDSINQGRSYILYTGHSGGPRWASPFNMSPTTKNYNRLPVIFSWCCQTVMRNNYIGQQWLKTGSLKKQKGAVAFIGTTTSGLYAPYRNFVARNFFRAVFEDKVFNIGKALKVGLDSLWTYTPDSFGMTLYSEWNLMGDPEMNLWTTVPQPMNVTYDSIIPLGQQNFSVSVTSQDGALIKNALVCLMMPNNPNFYYVSHTDQYGHLSFNIEPMIQDSIWITVTAQNRIPYEGKCLVGSSVSKSFIGQEPIDKKHLFFRDEK